MSENSSENPSESQYDDLLDRYRRGDEEAAEEIFHRYVGRLVALARSRLSSKLARRVDPEDVVQSVYRSFFVRARDGQYEVKRSGDMWRLLAAITINKLHKKVEFHTAKKRGMDQEKSVMAGGSMLGLPPEQVAREPSPSEAMVAVEELELIMQGLSPLQRRMLELHLQGSTVGEVAEEVGRSERAVRRLLALVKQQLEERAHHLASTQ